MNTGCRSVYCPSCTCNTAQMQTMRSLTHLSCHECVLTQSREQKNQKRKTKDDPIFLMIMNKISRHRDELTFSPPHFGF